MKYMIGQNNLGKSEAAMTAAEIAMDAGKSVVFATMNQRRMIDQLLKRFPGSLAEVIGDWGVKVHRPKWWRLHT